MHIHAGSYKGCRYGNVATTSLSNAPARNPEPGFNEFVFLLNPPKNIIIRNAEGDIGAIYLVERRTIYTTRDNAENDPFVITGINRLIEEEKQRKKKITMIITVYDGLKNVMWHRGIVY